MRYVIVDMEGASRDYFDTRDDVLEALRGLEEEHPGIAGELLVVTYDDEGRPVGEAESGEEVFKPLILEFEPNAFLATGASAADWTFPEALVTEATASQDWVAGAFRLADDARARPPEWSTA